MHEYSDPNLTFFRAGFTPGRVQREPVIIEQWQPAHAPAASRSARLDRITLSDQGRALAMGRAPLDDTMPHAMPHAMPDTADQGRARSRQTKQLGEYLAVQRFSTARE